METPVLTTERLSLRPIKESDTEKIFNCWMQDERISKYMLWKASDKIEYTISFVKEELGKIYSDNWKRWIIEKKESKEIIGTCLLYFNDEEEAYDISYNLGFAYFGNGYTTEVLREVLDFGIKKMGVKRIIASHAKENIASERVIQKLGFKYIKDIPFTCNGGPIKTSGKYYELNVK